MYPAFKIFDLPARRVRSIPFSAAKRLASGLTNKRSPTGFDVIGWDEGIGGGTPTDFPFETAASGIGAAAGEVVRAGS